MDDKTSMIQPTYIVSYNHTQKIFRFNFVYIYIRNRERILELVCENFWEKYDEARFFNI